VNITQGFRGDYHVTLAGGPVSDELPQRDGPVFFEMWSGRKIDRWGSDRSTRPRKVFSH